MTIELNQVVPLPLRDRLEKRPSDIWHTDLRIPMQDMVKVQAPSGSGKTTLIHYLYHLRSDYTGTLRWDRRSSHDFTDAALADWRQNTVSIVFQDLRLFP
ncbi:MAG TPA: ATP-binding cassette domain-containing protein, partial [Sediminibacterium sp.]|nr:ATP-binding cassette domain-containing protein [Sediminibacterium sp.]